MTINAWRKSQGRVATIYYHSHFFEEERTITTKKYTFMFFILLMLSVVLCGCSEQSEKTESNILATEWQNLSKEAEPAWASRDVEKILNLYSDDCVWEELAIGKVMSGKEEIRSFLNEWFAAFPDNTLETISSITSGNFRCAEWINRGTHNGDFLNIPATGKTFSIRGASIIELREGKIIRVSD
jgi:steroid delta-isomerase-like uncharacterized protein